MSNMLNNMEDILSQQISGFHQYILNDPIHLSYVSQNLCEMVGCNENELLSEHKDLYVQLVHPADRERYSELIEKLTKKEQTLTAEYRLIKKDGTVICVRDTVTSKKQGDGNFVANSVLTDISDIRSENNNLQFLNETLPCGFVKYTCEKQPKVTYINQKMIDILRFPKAEDGELDYLEMYKSNIFLVIPMEERRRFSKYLNRVNSAEAPIAGEITLQRCDGTRAYVFGWITKCVNEQGVEEFQSVCMDLTERHQFRKATETKRYMKALAYVYDKIFEFNLDANTVKCLHCEDTSTFTQFKDIPMQIEDALDKWIINAVEQSERNIVRRFFEDFCRKRLYEADAKPPQLTYRARSSSGEVNQYIGIFIKVDESISFFCCRRVHDMGEIGLLRTENTQLKENRKDQIMKFSDGIATFEVTSEGSVKPIYASENVCEFFGYTQEEWLSLTEWRMKAICSQRKSVSMSSRYVMLYYVENAEQDQKKELSDNRTVTIRTFGYFDVFVGDQPIAFRNKKSKELLALLVDRKGGYVTSEEAISFLWEDEPANTITLSRYRKVALRLKKTLEEYGISDVIETVDGKRRIIMEKVQCDLYQYLSGKEEYSSLFKGSYLSNYSWAETTLGELMNNQK